MSKNWQVLTSALQLEVSYVNNVLGLGLASLDEAGPCVLQTSLGLGIFAHMFDL